MHAGAGARSQRSPVLHCYRDCVVVVATPAPNPTSYARASVAPHLLAFSALHLLALAVHSLYVAGAGVSSLHPAAAHPCPCRRAKARSIRAPFDADV